MEGCPGKSPTPSSPADWSTRTPETPGMGTSRASRAGLFSAHRFRAKPVPDSIGEYLIIKEIPECLEEAKRLLSKGPDAVCQLRYVFNFTESFGNFVFVQK